MTYIEKVEEHVKWSIANYGYISVSAEREQLKLKKILASPNKRLVEEYLYFMDRDIYTDYVISLERELLTGKRVCHVCWGAGEEGSPCATCGAGFHSI